MTSKTPGLFLFAVCLSTLAVQALPAEPRRPEAPEPDPAFLDLPIPPSVPTDASQASTKVTTLTPIDPNCRDYPACLENQPIAAENIIEDENLIDSKLTTITPGDFTLVSRAKSPKFEMKSVKKDLDWLPPLDTTPTISSSLNSPNDSGSADSPIGSTSFDSPDPISRLASPVSRDISDSSDASVVSDAAGASEISKLSDVSGSLNSPAAFNEKPIEETYETPVAQFAVGVIVNENPSPKLEAPIVARKAASRIEFLNPDNLPTATENIRSDIPEISYANSPAKSAEEKGPENLPESLPTTLSLTKEYQTYNSSASKTNFNASKFNLPFIFVHFQHNFSQQEIANRTNPSIDSKNNQPNNSSQLGIDVPQNSKTFADIQQLQFFPQQTNLAPPPLPFDPFTYVRKFFPPNFFPLKNPIGNFPSEGSKRFGNGENNQNSNLPNINNENQQKSSIFTAPTQGFQRPPINNQNNNQSPRNSQNNFFQPQSFVPLNNFSPLNFNFDPFAAVRNAFPSNFFPRFENGASKQSNRASSVITGRNSGNNPFGSLFPNFPFQQFGG